MELPSTVPIFPLNDVLLVPGALLPLHIFEPRYRDMVADAMDGTRMIAMACCTGRAVFGSPAVDPVVGVGRILHRQLYPDGRSDIIIEGLARMEIQEELATEKSYRVVRARPFEEFEPTRDLRSRARLLLERISDFDDEEQELFAKLPFNRLLDSLLLRIPTTIEAKHEIFAMPRLEERLQALEIAMNLLEKPPSGMSFDNGDPRLN